MAFYLGKKKIEQVDCTLTISPVASEIQGTACFEMQWPPDDADLESLAQVAATGIHAGLVLSKVDLKRLGGERCRATYHYQAQDMVMLNVSQRSSEDPRYTLRGSCTAEPLLTHPKFKDLDTDILTALHAMMGGASRGETIKLAGGDEKTITEVIQDSEPAKKAAEFIEKGVTSYYCPGVTWQERVAARNMSGVSVSGLAKIASPSGGAPSGGSRNYLFSSIDAEMSSTGDRVDIVRSWELSGPNGWDSYLYT